jgi:hypothetical protein
MELEKSDQSFGAKINKTAEMVDIRGRCYDPNFLQFSPIFVEKTLFFAQFFVEKCFKS